MRAKRKTGAALSPCLPRPVLKRRCSLKPSLSPHGYLLMSRELLPARRTAAVLRNSLMTSHICQKREFRGCGDEIKQKITSGTFAPAQTHHKAAGVFYQRMNFQI